MKSVRIFSGLPDPLLQVVLDQCRAVSVRAGTQMQTAGDLPSSLTLVVAGQMRVIDERGDRHIAIDVLGPGASFGESLLDGATASFSVYSTTDADLLELSRSSLEHLRADPDIDGAIRDYLGNRDRLDEYDPSHTGAAAETAGRNTRVADTGGPTGCADDHRVEWTSACVTATRRRVWQRRPVVRQERATDAGPASLAAICAYYGRRISLARFRETSGATRAPATIAGLARAAGAFGFETFSARAGYQHLAANHLPAIAGWDDSQWVVVYRAADGGVTMADPAARVARLSRAEFERRWTGTILYLRPTDRLLDIEASAGPLARVTPYLRPLRQLTGELVAACLVIQLLNLLFPILAKFVIDDVIARGDARWLTTALFAMAGVLAVHLVTSVSRRYLVDFISRQVDARLLADFHKHLLHLPARFFEVRHVGDVVGRFEETGTITQFFATTGVGLFIDLVTAMLYVALMAHYSITVTAVALLCLVVEIVTLSLVTGRLDKGHRELSEHKLASDGLMIEALSGLKTIKILAIEHYVRWQLHDALARVVNASLATLTYRSIAALVTDVASNISTLAVLFYGAAMVLRGELTIGELVAFGILTRGLIAPFAQLVSGWDRLQAALRSVEQLNEIFEQQPEVLDEPSADQVVLHKLQGHIRFEAVSFRYQSDAPDVLHDVSFECYGGQRVAVLGPSGSGKSTLIKLLLGFYPATAGAVFVDGFDLATIWAPSLRRQTGVVLQEPALFRGSIRSNIGHTMPSAPLGDIVTAATLVNAHRFISALPQGYDTELDDNGANLSGGQRQQIALARALLHTPRLLVLDEATSNLDNESERRLEQNLGAAFRDSTVITITQRLAAAREADLILVLDAGAIVEQGTHDELLARGGLYSRFTQDQSSQVTS